MLFRFFLSLLVLCTYTDICHLFVIILQSRLLITDQASKHRRLPVVEFTCNANAICICPKEYYCPANSDLPKACNNPTNCNSLGCVNKSTCTSPDDPNRGKKTFLTKLIDITQPELNIGVTIQIYSDVGAATFNGSNGASLDIDLPFNWLPNISILFNNAPPFHCPFDGKDNDGNKLYTFAGIGLSTPLSVSVPVRNIAQKEEAIRDAASSAKDQIKAESAKFKDSFLKFVEDVKENKSSFRVSGESVGFGYSYTYDTSFNEVEDRYDWSKICGDAFTSQGPTTSPSKSPSKAPTVRIHTYQNLFCQYVVTTTTSYANTRLMFLMITHPLSALRQTQQPM